MSLGRKVFIGIGSIIVIILLVVGIALYATSGLLVPIEGQLIALRSGDIVKAYAFTSKDFQNVTSMADFEKFIERYPSLKNNERASFPTREISNHIGTVKGTLIAKDGAATPIEYNLTKEDGEWKIMALSVNPVGISVEKNSPSLQSAQVTTPPAPAQSGPLVLDKTYDNKDSRYTIRYPAHWMLEKSGPGTIIFSGEQGTPSYFSTVNIQTVQAKKIGGQFSTVDEFIQDLKNQGKTQAKDITFSEQGPITIKGPDGADAKGQYIIFTYNYRNHDFKQWQVVVLRHDEQVFYAWAYTSPRSQYDADLSVAKEMLKTWSIY